MSFIKQFKILFASSITCIPVKYKVCRIDNKNIPLFSLKAENRKLSFKKILINLKNSKGIVSNYRTGFTLYPNKLLALLIIYEGEKIIIEFPLNNIHCCSKILGLFENKKFIIENIDQPDDGLFIVPIEEAIKLFYQDFENKIKPILFRKFYLFSIKDSTLKSAVEIDSIRFENPELYDEVFEIFKKKYK